MPTNMPASSSPIHRGERSLKTVAQGKRKALVVLGHANSEEAGMKWLVEWLRPRFPDVKATHVGVGDPFYFV